MSELDKINEIVDYLKRHPQELENFVARVRVLQNAMETLCFKVIKDKRVKASE